MRRAVLLALALLLLLARCALADHGMGTLLGAVSHATYMGDADFEGEPGNDYAWAVLSSYVNNYGEMGGQHAFTQADIEGMFKGLFERGTLGEPPENSQFVMDGEAYTFSYADGEPITRAAINALSDAEGGTCDVDFTAYKISDAAGEWFAFNATATLVPDDAASEGYLVRRFQILETKTIRPGAAEANAVLNSQSGNSYGAKNAIDGKLATCWAYDDAAEHLSQPALTLTFDEPTEVRGIQLTPGYAKSEAAYQNNRRVKKLRITLDTGRQIEAELEDVYDFTSLAVIPFEGVETVTSIEIAVEDSYPGERFDDICISEVQTF